MSKSFMMGFIVGLALLVVAGVGASRLQDKAVQSKDKSAEERQFAIEALDASPVQLGVLTPQQRAHSKLYLHYSQLRRKTIGDLVTQVKGKYRIVGTVVEVGLLEAPTEPETPESYFGKLADKSDVILRGKVTSKVSQVTEDGSFIFTDYKVAVSEVMKNNQTSPLRSSATITVTHPGGESSD